MKKFILLFILSLSSTIYPIDVDTALIYAAKKGDLKEAKSFIKNGANINASVYINHEDKDSTALMMASKNGHINIVKLLLKHGADINARGYKQEGHTALMLASKNGHINIVKLLLKNGADVSLVEISN